MDPNRKILFSIVTVCKNPGGSLDSTIQSLRKQTSNNYEHIIVDGGSTDGTVEYLELRRHLVANYISESDNGIYHAMNKGVAMARGEYIYFLNCGDSFFDADVLKNVEQSIMLTEGDFIYGDSCLQDLDSGKFSTKKHDRVDKFYLFHRPINHQAIFARRSLFETVGLFDTSFVVKADHEWILRCFCQKVKFVYIPIVVTNFVLHGFAFQNRGKYRVAEKKRIQNRYFRRVGIAVTRILHRVGFTPGSTLRQVLNLLL